MAFNCPMDSSDCIFSILRATVRIKALFSYHLGLETVQASSTSPAGRFHTHNITVPATHCDLGLELFHGNSQTVDLRGHVFLAFSQLGLEGHACFAGETFWRTTMMLFCHRNHMLPSRMLRLDHTQSSLLS